MSLIDAAIAAHRFGMGAAPGELESLGADPEAWLSRQVSKPAAFTFTHPALVSGEEGFRRLSAYLAEQAAARRGEADPKDAAGGVMRNLAPLLGAEISARIDHALTTPDGFAERLALFWCNHFTVAASKLQTIPLAGAFEREAIRPNLTGRFADLLLAATRHPGMLSYLDQTQSVGPSTAVARRRDRGLNENLAREILELHTLGVHGGYTQADVTEFARALTGWSVVSRFTRRLTGDAPEGRFVFLEPVHEPGTRTLLGKRYDQKGEAQARAILADLAAHPATARHIATKLATHFIADTPPESAIAALEASFNRTGGQLQALHLTLIGLREAWAPEPAKFKTPYDFLISGLRALGRSNLPVARLQASFQLLGQPPLRAPSPAGWPDDEGSWSGPDAIMKRLEWVQALVREAPQAARPEDMFASLLGPLARPRTLTEIARAESAAQGLALALMSPDFQRR